MGCRAARTLFKLNWIFSIPPDSGVSRLITEAVEHLQQDQFAFHWGAYVITSRSSLKARGRGFVVRRAKLSDLEVLVHQRRGMWEDMGVDNRSALDEADEVYRRWARKRLNDRSLVCWVAENQSGTIMGGGCLWLQPVQPKPGLKKRTQPYLLSMYTEPRFRRVGVGSRIVEEAIKWGKRNGYPWVTLHASDTGRHIYRNYGFRRAWEMRLEL